MDWEQKFSSIICETDANLDRVKEKLHNRHIVGSGNRTFDDDFYSRRSAMPTERQSLSMIQYPAASTPKTVRWQNSNNPVGVHDVPDTYTLCCKLEQQNKTIDQLSNLVRVMERERDENKEQITDLKYEVRELSKRVSNNEKEENLQRQITILKKDICKEVENIRDQVQFYKTRHGHEIRQEHREDADYSTSRSKDISEMRQMMHDEVEYVRSDVETLRRRLGLIETQIQCNNGSDRHSSRIHKVMERLSDNRRFLHETRDIIPTTLSNKTLDKCEMEHLRLNVSSLREKLDQVEEKLHQSLNNPTSIPSSRAISGSTRTKRKYHTKINNDIMNSDLDDLDDLELSDDKFDLSDDLDSDLDDLEEDGAPDITSTRRKTLQKQTVDDLDFELMKMSEKDDIDSYLSDDSDDLDNILDDVQ